MLFKKKEDAQKPNTPDMRDIQKAMQDDEEMPTAHMKTEKFADKPTFGKYYPSKTNVYTEYNEDRDYPRVAPPPMQGPGNYAVPQHDPETSAPLFVKVDKYREVLTTIHEIKLFISSSKQLFTVLHELEALRSDAINVMRATLQRIEKSVTEIDTDLLRPKGLSLSDMNIATTEIRHLEDTLTEMQGQLSVLRQQMHGMK